MPWHTKFVHKKASDETMYILQYNYHYDTGITVKKIFILVCLWFVLININEKYVKQKVLKVAGCYFH